MRLSYKFMASRKIIGSFVRPWGLIKPGIREWQWGKIRSCRPHPLELGLHAIFALACGAMGVLTPVVEVTTLPVFHPRQDLPFRRAVALQLIRNDHPWHILESLEQLPKELLRRLLVAPALHQDIQYFVVLIDSAPQVMALPINRQENFIQMPFV